MTFTVRFRKDTLAADNKFVFLPRCLTVGANQIIYINLPFFVILAQKKIYIEYDNDIPRICQKCH